MFKRNIFKILAIVFFLLSGASFYNSYKTKPVVVQNKIVQPTILGRENPVPTVKPTQIIIFPTQIPAPQSFDYTQDKPTSVPPTSAPQKLKVTLKISDSSVGEIEVSPGANQCDVLSQALSSGKIQSLNMRYNNDMGTNAVYQINGVGKENAIWWVFKVNGQSPSQGCSYIKVNNGDNSEWSYLGN